MLILTMKEGNYFMLGDDICIKYVEDSSSGYIKIGIDAPKSCKVIRDAVYERDLNSELSEVLCDENSDVSKLKSVLAKQKKVSELKSSTKTKTKKKIKKTA